MLPEYSNVVTIDTEVLPSKTFSIAENAGMIDNLEAVKQAVEIILDVNRYESPILPWSFGNEMRNLIGEPMDFAAIESERYIKEALKQDDRITDVVDFEFTDNGGALLASYRVTTIYGDFTRETEVSL
jgi:phage baseplate assembly protein W